MRFVETAIPGVHVVEAVPHEDERGSFTRIFSRDEFEQRGLVGAMAQTSVSRNRRRGTLRGLHLQALPHPETKLVSCLRGTIFDVAVDARRGSPTFGHFVSAELSLDNGRMLYIPAGVAHGFVTLEDDALVHYQISEAFRPELALGIRFDDPQIAIPWPIRPEVISARDRSLPTLASVASGSLPLFPR